MMNIKSAISQMRVARRLGKISSEQAARLLRRLGHSYALSQHEKIKAEFLAPPSPEWLEMMALRNAIEADVTPALEAARNADDLLNNPAERRKTFMDACVENYNNAVSGKVKAPKLVGYEFTRAWWDEQEVKERTNRKLGTPLSHLHSAIDAIVDAGFKAISHEELDAMQTNGVRL